MDDQRQVLLEGDVHARLVPLLDGTRSVADLAQDVGPESSFYEVLAALTQLERRGCLAEGEAEGPGHRLAFLDGLPGGPGAVGRMAAARVSVTALGALRTEALAEALAAEGLAQGEPGDLHIVLADDYLRPELEDVNRDALERRRPWLLVKPVGLVPWIGPVFVPGTTGCWSCLAQRLRANRQMEKYILDRAPQEAPLLVSRAAFPATVELAVQLAVLEAVKWLVAPADGLEGRMVSFDVLTRQEQEHVLTRRPQCPSCGDPALRNRPPVPVALTSQRKQFRADGGHRVRRPEETLERYRHHISPILGAVTELRPALGKQSELTPIYVAGHNFSMGIDSVVFLRETVRGMSGGKGATRVQAMASGLCEAIERYSGMHWGDEYTVRGSLRALAPAAIHPNECMGFSEEQYHGRDEWNRSQPASRCVLVPHALSPEAEVDWAPLWSLTTGEQRLLPAAFCYYGHPEFKDRWCIPDSNGCAAGNTLEEAILQGFMELVERDAVAIWWYNRIQRRGVDLDSFGLPYLGAIVEYYRSLGRRLWVLDITNDLGIAALACVSSRIEGPTEDVLVGFGSHFDPKVALLRAITEVNQFLPSVSQTRPDGSTMYLFGDELARNWWTSARIGDLNYLTPDPAQPPVALDEFRDPSTDDLADDVRTCVEIAGKTGLEVLVQDMTRPDLGLSVVRVAVPGLCHFWRRLGFRRLYEVPVTMGWLARPLAPEQLNPYTVFF